SSVYADGVLLPSVYAPGAPGVGTLSFAVPETIPGMQAPGAVAITVINYGTYLSNTVAFPIGSGGNAGVVFTNPLAPAPGTPYSIHIEGGPANQPFTLIASSPPASSVALAGTPFILGIDPASIIAVLDGLGIFGPGVPAVLVAPPSYSYAVGGGFV